MGLYREALFRGRFQHAHVPVTHHGHMQRPGNGGCGQRQHIHLIFHVFDDFLMCNPKALLFIHN